MAAIVRKWRRWMATGCLHSTHACKEYMRNVRAFKADFKPERHIELGDVIDTACLRGGARGTKDEAEPLDGDLSTGLSWVQEMEPSDWMLGNHCTRPYELMDHPSAIISELSKRLVADMQKAAASVHCKIHPYDIRKGWIRIGDAFFGHGFMFNVSALRDHVEMMGGNVVMAHTHIASLYPGRNFGGHWGISVGTGADPDRMGYARRRRQTLAWGHGIAYGEYCDSRTTSQLIRWNCEHGAKEEPRWLI